RPGPGLAGAWLGWRLAWLARSPALAEPVGHLELLAHRAPHHLRVLAVREGLVDRAAAQARQHGVLRNALRRARAELLPHPCPKFRQPHGPRLPARGEMPGPRANAQHPPGDNRDI